MKYLLLSFAATVVLFQLTSAQLSKRCQSVCSRSDGQEFCQRCRMRVPMRFGKRVDPSPTDPGDDPSDPSQPLHLQRDLASSEEGPYDDPSRMTPKKNLRMESRLLLNSMRNFARDLEDWDREVYDQ